MSLAPSPNRALRPEEEWARLMMESALSCPVRGHDDGSRPAMHDLVIQHPDGRRGAVEVVAAADSRSIELWNLMNGRRRRWVEPALSGGWIVDLRPTARWRHIKRTLPELLAALEAGRITDLRPCATSSGSLGRRARDLGIVSAVQGPTSFAGSIYPLIEEPLDDGTSYMSGPGDPLAHWIGTFLRDARQHDVIEKLRRADADECHAFVLVPSFSTAPSEVSYRLMCDDAWLPDMGPDLPSPITDAWMVSTWSCGLGYRWSTAGGWGTFTKVDETRVT